MNISDLTPINLDNDVGAITGSVNFALSSSLYTNATAIAKTGYAYANAQAIALGQNTVTLTQMYAATYVDHSKSVSFAYAKAYAASSTGGSFSYWQIERFAFSISY